MTASLSAQTHVKGQVVDSLSSEPISFATLGVYPSNNPKQIVKAMALDENGKFDFIIPNKGNYILDIQYVGKESIKKEISIAEEKNLNVGIIKMVDLENELGEVTVTATKPLVKVEIDKLVYNMEEDPEAKTNSAFEMLRKVPMVTIDGEDNIELKGSSSYKIFINGKPSNMIASNPKDVLKGMPASTIKNIEVITEPGAKYDAEGLAGIINIITTTQTSMQGYTVTLNGRVDTRGGFGGGTFFTTKVGKLGITGNYSYYDYKNPRGTNESLREEFNSDNERYLKRNGSNKYDGHGQYGSGELSYEVDTLNLITFGFNRNQGSSNSKSDNISLMLDKDNQRYYEYSLASKSKNTYGNTSFNLDYQNTAASNKDRLFTISYRYSTSPNDVESNSNTQEVFNFPGDMKKQYSDGKTEEHTIQIDYTTPIYKSHIVETGVKYISRISKSNSGNSIWDETTNIWEDKPSVNDKFKHTQDIYSAYLGYKTKVKSFGFQTGVRYEGTDLKAKFPIDNKNNFKNDYSNFVPSVNLSYSLTPTKTLKASYNMRIYRPGIYQLNPFVNTSDTSYISKGNPDLKAVKSHDLGLNFSSFSSKLQLNTSLSYNFSNNDIQSFTTLEDGISTQSYDNIGKMQNVNLFTYFSWSLTSRLKLNSNTSIRYKDLKANNNLNLKNHGFEGSAFGGLQYQVPNMFKKDAKSLVNLSLNGGWGSRRVSLMGKGSSFYYYVVSLNKSFLNDKMTVRAYSVMPFNKDRTFENNDRTNQYSSFSKSTFKVGQFGFSISYRFGEMKTQIKKAKRGINNDDAMSSGGGEGGQQGGGEG